MIQRFFPWMKLGRRLEFWPCNRFGGWVWFRQWPGSLKITSKWNICDRELLRPLCPVNIKVALYDFVLMELVSKTSRSSALFAVMNFFQPWWCNHKKKWFLKGLISYDSSILSLHCLNFKIVNDLELTLQLYVSMLSNC